MYKLFKPNGVEHWKLYKKLKTQTKNQILLAKKTFYKTSIEDAKGNSKKMWSVLKYILPKCKGAGISSLELN